MKLNRILRRLCVLLFPIGATLMVNLASANPAKDDEQEGFSIIKPGDTTFATNYISVRSSRKIYVGLFEAMDSESNSVGVFLNRLSSEDVKSADSIHLQLCRAAQEGSKDELPRVEPADIYSVQCNVQEKIVSFQGKIYELPRELAFSIQDFYRRAQEQYISDARGLVKLSIRVDKLELDNGKIVVSISLSNSGQYPLKIDRPDQWDKRFYHLRVSGQRVGTKEEWNSDLIGLPLTNESDFQWQSRTTPDGRSVAYTTIAPRASTVFKFLAAQSGKTSKGAYDFSATASLYVNVAESEYQMGRVRFHSDYKNPTRITIDRDYPSTPQEWKDYEERHRTEVAPVAPGAAITEPGYYRAVSQLDGPTPLLREFKADDIAPALADLRLPQWLWVADIALRAICEPGESCPRDGRWVPRTTDWKGFETHARHERRFRVGETMSAEAMAGVDRYFTWTWLGA